jgi:hypothetical protein
MVWSPRPKTPSGAVHATTPKDVEVIHSFEEHEMESI